MGQKQVNKIEKIGLGDVFLKFSDSGLEIILTRLCKGLCRELARHRIVQNRMSRRTLFSSWCFTRQLCQADINRVDFPKGNKTIQCNKLVSIFVIVFGALATCSPFYEIWCELHFKHSCWRRHFLLRSHFPLSCSSAGFYFYFFENGNHFFTMVQTSMRICSKGNAVRKHDSSGFCKLSPFAARFSIVVHQLFLIVRASCK